MLAAHWFMPLVETLTGGAVSHRATFAHGCAWGLVVSGSALAVLLAPNGETPPFIYFQF